MKKRFLRASISLPIFVAGLCGVVREPAFADDAAKSQVHRIGVLAPLSGNFASYGKSVREAIQSVQVPGITWIFEDDSCEASKAVTAFKKLSTADGVSFFIGPCCGSPQKAVAPLLNNQDRIALLPSAAPSSVFEASGKRMYSAQYSLEADGTFLADQMNARNLQKVAIVYVDNEFSQALEAGFLRAFKGRVAYSVHAPAFDAQYMKAAALALKGVDFDALFIPDASPFLLGFLTELKKLGVGRRPAFSVYAAQMPDVLASEKENAEGLLYSYPDVPEDADAFSYFPKLAAELLARTVADCDGKAACVLQTFSRNQNFQSDGTLSGNIVLRAVREGKFAPLKSSGKG